MILGVIHGPSEPKIHINPFLKPIVDDLLLRLETGCAGALINRLIDG